jgi:hypothetical protein
MGTQVRQGFNNANIENEKIIFIVISTILLNSNIQAQNRYR